MRKILSTMILLTLTLAAGSPGALAGTRKDAQKAYESGDYIQASLLAMQHLRGEPKDRKAAELLSTVLPIAYKTIEAAVQSATISQDHDALVAEYKKLAMLSNETLTLPPIFEKKSKTPIEWPTVDVTAQLTQAVDDAAEFHYAKGVQLYEQGGGPAAAQEFASALEYKPQYKDAATLAADSHYIKGVQYQDEADFKSAAVEFRSTRKYAGSYKDSEERYLDCRTAATKRVAIMPFENKSGKAQYGAVGELLSGQVLSKALKLDPEFIEFVDRNQLAVLLAEKGQQDFGVIQPGNAPAAGKLAGVHAFVFGDILMINEDFPGDQVNGPQTNTVESKDYKTGAVTTYRATYYLHTRKGAVDVTASLAIVDGETGAMINADQLQAGRSDEARWVTFKGDEYAVPQQIISAQTPGGERLLRTAQTMVTDSIDEISSSLADRLVDTFD